MKHDRRRFARKRQEMQVYFMCVGAEKDVKGTGVTRDVSRGGVYFWPEHCHCGNALQKGDKLRLRIDGHRCDGRVLRVDRSPAPDGERPTGVAVRLHGSPGSEWPEAVA